MAKANSPVRLDAKLMEEAVTNGRIMNRSAAQTIEYWASIGRRVYKLIDPEVLSAIEQGDLKVEIHTSRMMDKKSSKL